MEELIMKWNNEEEARQYILQSVADYYHSFKEDKTDYVAGNKVPYAGRVYDEKEMCSLTEAVLDFWLTSGRFVDKFEHEFAKWLGVKYTSLVNSGSSANLVAFFTLTAPELGERAIKRGDEEALTPAYHICL